VDYQTPFGDALLRMMLTIVLTCAMPRAPISRIPRQLADLPDMDGLSDLDDPVLMQEIADAILDAFSELHPDIKMNRAQWADLSEMIQREVAGMLGSSEARLNGTAPYARDLLS
jgi:hypothetical protein